MQSRHNVNRLKTKGAHCGAFLFAFGASAARRTIEPKVAGNRDRRAFLEEVARRAQAEEVITMLMNAVTTSTSTIPSSITGQSIAKARKWNARTRAFWAAGWVLGLTSIKPTTKLAAEVFRVSVPYVNDAIAELGTDADYERWLNGQGSERLNGQDSESLAEHLLRSTPEEMIEAGRKVGPAVIWDRMIAPIV